MERTLQQSAVGGGHSGKYQHGQESHATQSGLRHPLHNQGHTVNWYLIRASVHMISRSTSVKYGAESFGLVSTR